MHWDACRPRCPSCRSPIKAAHHARTLQRAVASARHAAEPPTLSDAAEPQGASSGSGSTAELRQRRGGGSTSNATRRLPSADAAIEPVLLTDAATTARNVSHELAAALHRIRRRRSAASATGQQARATWTFHGRTLCCVDIRVFAALVCAVTVVINLLLLRLQIRRDALEAAQHPLLLMSPSDHSALGGADDPAAAAAAAAAAVASVGVTSAAAASNCFSVRKTPLWGGAILI